MHNNPTLMTQLSPVRAAELHQKAIIVFFKTHTINELVYHKISIESRSNPSPREHYLSVKESINKPTHGLIISKNNIIINNVRIKHPTETNTRRR